MSCCHRISTTTRTKSSSARSFIITVFRWVIWCSTLKKFCMLWEKCPWGKIQSDRLLSNRIAKHTLRGSHQSCPNKLKPISLGAFLASWVLPTPLLLHVSMDAQLTHEQIAFTFPSRWFEFPKLNSLSASLQSLYSRVLCVFGEYKPCSWNFIWLRKFTERKTWTKENLSENICKKKDSWCRENVKNRKIF